MVRIRYASTGDERTDHAITGEELQCVLHLHYRLNNPTLKISKLGYMRI